MKNKHVKAHTIHDLYKDTEGSSQSHWLMLISHWRVHVRCAPSTVVTWALALSSPNIFLLLCDKYFSRIQLFTTDTCARPLTYSWRNTHTLVFLLRNLFSVFKTPESSKYFEYIWHDYILNNDQDQQISSKLCEHRHQHQSVFFSQCFPPLFFSRCCPTTLPAPK